MSKLTKKRLGVALVGLAVPFMVAGPAAAAPGADEVAAVHVECLNYFDISTCAGAVTDGIYDVIEDEVNWSLGGDYVVELGEAGLNEPGSLAYDINAIAVNPLPPMIPVPAVPGVPFQ